MVLLPPGFAFVKGSHALANMLLPYHDACLPQRLRVFTVSVLDLAPSIFGAHDLDE